MEGKPASSKTHQTITESATQIADQETPTELSPSKTHQTTGQSATQVREDEPSEKPKKPRKWRRVKRKKEELIPSEIGEIEGVRKITISPLVQNLLKCRVGEHVTSEYPWHYVKKETLEDNLELHEESSEFLPLKEEILIYPAETMLVIYIPSEMREYDEFYICLTSAAEQAVLEIINNILAEREERLNNSIWKIVGQWKTLGSESEVAGIQVINNRPLLEVEIETEYPIKPTKMEFRLRLVENAQDGYAELLCARQSFANLYRSRLDVGIQVAPTVAQNGSQTVCYRRNAYTQYEYEFPPLKALGKEFRANMQDFIDNKMTKLSDLLYVNNNIDFYKNDYLSLVRDIRYTSVLEPLLFVPYASFIHPPTCDRKEIICHSWHPMWSGTVAIAYAHHKLCDYRKFDGNEDEVVDAMYDVTPVLLWSFQDCLEPKLFLETPRAITQLSWCPYDENVLVGGCLGGQVVVWDITDKLKSVEEEEILTVNQRKYRMQMHSLMGWFKNTKDLKRVRPTVISELEYSHRSLITCITWMSTYREISKTGLIKDIPDDENRTSLQFMTASVDGTVVAWDLQSKPSYTSTFRPPRKLRRLKKRPSALTVAVSPYRPLNRVFKPTFKVNVMVPNSTRLLPITELNIRVATVEYVEKNPDPNRIFCIADRIIYKSVSTKPTHPLVNQFVAGSAEGDFMVASWEGFDFNSGEVVNKESCKFENLARYHDGPVVAISRSSIFPDLILTVGGKVFALWKISFIGKPMFWKRSKVRYTHGVWNSYRPSVFRLSREDGHIELWHLRTRSDRYTTLLFLSGQGLGVITTHPRTMKQNIVGVVGSKGLFELFYVSQDFTLTTEEDKWSTYRFCERELERKKHFIKWQDDWIIEHADEIKAKQEQKLKAQQDKEQALKEEKAHIKEQEAELKREMSEALAKTAPDPGKFADWARDQLRLREQERMMKEMLRKKHLDMAVLMKQRIPVLKIEEEKKIKRANQEKRASVAEKLFEDTVAQLFPLAVEKKPPPPPDPYAGGDSMEVKAQLFEKYLALSEEYETYVKERQYYYHFNWLNLKQSGRERRKFFDGLYKRYNHKLRLVNEKQQKQRGSVATYIESKESQTSIGSIEYDTASDTFVAEEQNNVELHEVD